MLKNLLFRKWLGKNFALGSPTIDLLGFPRHFLSLKFLLFRDKWSFSTPTPDFINNQQSQPMVTKLVSQQADERLLITR